VGLSSSIEPLFPLFAANAPVASSKASPGSRLLEMIETFIYLFIYFLFFPEKRRESFLPIRRN
jgi:hypothetical protein